jgi:hypothetical protein
MEVYQSEVSRLKLLLAAKAGDAELVNFLQKEKSGDMAELRKRIMSVSFFENSYLYRNVGFTERPKIVFPNLRSRSPCFQSNTLISPITCGLKLKLSDS